MFKSAFCLTTRAWVGGGGGGGRRQHAQSEICDGQSRTLTSGFEISRIKLKCTVIYWYKSWNTASSFVQAPSFCVRWIESNVDAVLRFEITFFKLWIYFM